MKIYSLSLLAGLAACHSAPAPACQPAELSILSFNIEYGGDLVDFGQVVAAIRSSGASIVALEEAYGHTDRLADSLGWNFDRRTQILSREHLVAQRGASGTAISLIETSPGCAVAIANVHLPSDPTVDTLVTQGKVDSILATERRVRLPPLHLVLGDLAPLAARGMPVFLAGDFNAGSHLDGQIPWPTSLATAAAGFTDSYRATHRDAGAHPGYTWWAGRPRVKGWNPSPTDLQQRIDYILSAGRARPLTSRILGEAGGRDVELAFTPWVSDHRALLSAFELTAAPFPILVTVPHQRVAPGDSITVELVNHADGATVVVSESGVDRPAGGRNETPAAKALGLQTLRLGSERLTPGSYEVVLRSKERLELARSRFWVVERNAAPSIAVDSTPVPSGRPITVRWTSTVGNRWDWVGVYAMQARPDSSNPLVWQHTGATVNGVARLDAKSDGSEWPLPPGEYRVVLGLDDSYMTVAETRLSIIPR